MEGGCSVETTLLLPSNCPLDPLEPGEIGYSSLSYVYFLEVSKKFSFLWYYSISTASVWLLKLCKTCSIRFLLRGFIPTPLVLLKLSKS